MDPTKYSPEVILSNPSLGTEQLNSQKSSKLKAANVKPSDTQETSNLSPQCEQEATPLSSTATLTQSNQESDRQVPGDLQNSIPTSGAATTRVRNQETFSRAPQGRQATFPPASSAARSRKNPQGAAHSGHQEPRKSLSNSSRETHHNAPLSSHAQRLEERYTNMEQHYTEIVSQNHELQNQLKKNQAALASLQTRLAESEARREELQQHLEEASNTIFRLRPQREEYTESEIEEDYLKLTKIIRNWISINCESFVDDDLRGFDTINNHMLGPGAQTEPFETIIFRFQSEPNRWTEAKEHILVAVVMRYLFDRILKKPFSVLLGDGEQDFLAIIQNSMGNMEPQKDLLTIRTWRSDTITAIESHDSFTKHYPPIEQKFAIDLYNVLKKTFSSQHNESILQSLSKSIVAPTVALARKTQSAISIWTFRYSDYSRYPPGEFGSNLPDFLTNVQGFRCINMSNGDKTLKPATDLKTEQQQENLLHVLDIFPGLYCQRVTVGDAPPVSTISQPVLLVAFATAERHQHTLRDISQPFNSPRTANQNRKPSPARLDSIGRGFLHTAGRYLGISDQR